MSTAALSTVLRAAAAVVAPGAAVAGSAGVRLGGAAGVRFGGAAGVFGGAAGVHAAGVRFGGALHLVEKERSRYADLFETELRLCAGAERVDGFLWRGGDDRAAAALDYLSASRCGFMEIATAQTAEALVDAVRAAEVRALRPWTVEHVPSAARVGTDPRRGCHVDIPRASRRRRGVAAIAAAPDRLAERRWRRRRRGRVAAPPPRGATWIFRGRVERIVLRATRRIVRGRVAAPPRPRRG